MEYKSYKIIDDIFNYSSSCTKYLIKQYTCIQEEMVDNPEFEDKKLLRDIMDKRNEDAEKIFKSHFTNLFFDEVE